MTKKAKRITPHKDSILPEVFEQRDEQFILLNRVGFMEHVKSNEYSRKIWRIQNHHTWRPDYDNFNGDDHFDDLKAMDRYHEEENKWSDIGQNITIFPDGMIGICRPFDKTPAGIYGANKGSLCLEAYGNFDIDGDEMTEAQRESILFVNACLCVRFEITPSTDTIVYHHWWNSKGKRTNGTDGGAKSCPGTNFFGGNKPENALEHFIPKITSKIKLIKLVY